MKHFCIFIFPFFSFFIKFYFTLLQRCHNVALVLQQHPQHQCWCGWLGFEPFIRPNASFFQAVSIKLMTCWIYKIISQCSEALYCWRLSKKVFRSISYKVIYIPFLISVFYKYHSYWSYSLTQGILFMTLKQVELLKYILECFRMKNVFLFKHCCPWRLYLSKFYNVAATL